MGFMQAIPPTTSIMALSVVPVTLVCIAVPVSQEAQTARIRFFEHLGKLRPRALAIDVENAGAADANGRYWLAQPKGGELARFERRPGADGDLGDGQPSHAIVLEKQSPGQSALADSNSWRLTRAGGGCLYVAHAGRGMQLLAPHAGWRATAAQYAPGPILAFPTRDRPADGCAGSCWKQLLPKQVNLLCLPAFASWMPMRVCSGPSGRTCRPAHATCCLVCLPDEWTCRTSTSIKWWCRSPTDGRTERSFQFRSSAAQPRRRCAQPDLSSRRCLRLSEEAWVDGAHRSDSMCCCPRHRAITKRRGYMSGQSGGVGNWAVA